jgi:protein subunit release factor A
MDKPSWFQLTVSSGAGGNVMMLYAQDLVDDYGNYA